jgi:ankyrin repeat protein
MIPNNTPGTCEWVLISRPFTAWLSGAEPNLRILGDPGVGKTVLAKYLYRQLREVFSDSVDSLHTHRPQWASHDSINLSRPRHILAYFFDVKTSSRNGGFSVLQSLLYQILSKEPDLFKYIHKKPLFSRPQQTKFSQYVEILNRILRDPSLQGTVIILDALDECDEEYGETISKVLSALVEQQGIQLLVTSRLKWDCSRYLIIDMKDSMKDVKHDVEKYVITAVEKIADAAGFSPDLESDIISGIPQQCSGNFLWAQLVLQRVSKARTVRMVCDVLEKRPMKLKESYSIAFNEVTGFAGINIRRTLYFVMVAKVPLHIREVSALLAVLRCWKNPDAIFRDYSEPADVFTTFSMNDITGNQTISLEQDLERDSQHLLSVKGGSLSLAHSTLREFLEQEAGTNFRATFGFPQSHMTDLRLSDVDTMVAILCLQYMLADCLLNTDPLGFLDFACRYWTEHARASRGPLTWLLEYMIQRLFMNNASFTSIWLDSVSNAKTMPLALLPKSANFVCVLAAFDLADTFGTRFQISVSQLKSTNQNGQTPLHFAAANNALASTHWIQKFYHKAGKNFGDLATLKDSHGQSPVSLAAQHGHDAMMKLLLTSLRSPYSFDLISFQAIADTGDRELFETLYDHTMIECLEEYRSLLISAVKFDSVDLIKKIYTAYTNQENPDGTATAIQDTDNDPLLHIALQSHAYDVFDYLFDMRGYRDIIDKHGNTVLHIAAQEGAVEPARKLLTAGARVNAINKRMETPLHIASSMGSPAMVRLLCENKADVKMPGPSGSSPAHLAIKTGNKETIDILFEYGTDNFATDNKGRSMLHIAAASGQEEILATLLAHNPEVDAWDYRGRTPVHDAVQSENLSILYMLILARADLSFAPDLEHTSPLHLAAAQGSEIMVRELLCLGCDPNVRDVRGRTALKYAFLAMKGEASSVVVRALVKAGAEVDAEDREKALSLRIRLGVE